MIVFVAVLTSGDALKMMMAPPSGKNLRSNSLYIFFTLKYFFLGL